MITYIECDIKYDEKHKCYTLGTIPENCYFKGFFIDENDEYKLKLVVDIIEDKNDLR